MRSFEQLVAEADAADVSGWSFDWLDGRATEERPPWGYAGLLADALAGVESALDLQTGGGEVVGEAPELPRRMAVTEGWPPNVEQARNLLGPRGVEVVDADQDAPLPFADASFAMVSARHPVWSNWAEISRVLVPGGRYLGQHVGPASGFDLIERFLGPLPEHVRNGRSPDGDRAGATAAGLVVDEIRSASCRMEFFDIGAVVWTLRKLVWWVPDFTSTRYDATLRELDALIRRDGRFVAHSTRLLVRAHKPARDIRD
ncbi:methyltransferase domain-containing protein [Flexivirga sp. ID2601S]|uniref:Methyltransferase domain-containing protein n=1 Tax=Flexivirga aerilata TaxID=1656889 RepID=A0A849AS02_9MICO|nr:methyltransferase domain-containing protein [Flexivirga aerilata]NNG41060.1 methyltransferase domain-containing protein [Flexivirga aerilata]